jgi:hypothetical protein
MGPFDFALHLLSFAAPAFVLALATALGARAFGIGGAAGRSWKAAFALNFIAGVVVLAAGLWWFGRDGKMATYAALAIAIGTTQWLAARAWRG